MSLSVSGIELPDLLNRWIEQQVRRRSHGHCEYCRLPESVSKLRFSVDHIIARQHGGLTELENLALACGFCNRHKGPNISGIDPKSGKLSPLFNPKNQQWGDHFRWRGAIIVPRTGIGRTTITVLALNHSQQIAVRAAIIAERIELPG